MKPDDAQWSKTYLAKTTQCSAGRADRPKTGKPVVLVKMSWEDQVNVPLMIPLRTARRMLVDFVYILSHFGDDLAQQIKMLHFPEWDWPSSVPPVKRRCPRRRQFPPSINAATPSRPIHETDVWHLIQMLRRVQSHDDFLRLIGAPDLTMRKPLRSQKPRKKRRQ